jgi:DNA-binding MarR family transcriptional regulator
MKRARHADDPVSAARTADRLHSVAIHLLRRLRAEAQQSGLSGPRLSALSVVVFGGPITLGELAAAEQVRPPTMTRLVAALEERGLVARDSDESDARIVRLRATAKGMRLLQEGRGRRIARLQHRLQSLDKPELQLITDATELLEVIVRDL